jgi:hypothetical protein
MRLFRKKLSRTLARKSKITLRFFEFFCSFWDPWNSFGITRPPRSFGAPKMARLRKEDAAERRTAFFGFQLTPAERARLDRHI